jgi:hypothetical protein
MDSMNKKLKETIKLAIILTTLLTTNDSLANSLDSITSVSELKKIQTTDPKYQELQYLTSRYHCTTKLQHINSRSVTRYEFAVGISNCWQQLENSSNSQDLMIWRRLKQDFASELSLLRNNIEQVTANLTQIESQQFSTTTKLRGQVLFFVADSFSEKDNSQTFSGYRTRLDLNTSFSGQDVLQIRLESRNIGRLDDVTNTPLTRLSVDGTSENRFEIAEFSYTFPVGDSTIIVLGTTGVGLNDIGEVLNPFSSSSKGAVSRFARRNPATLRGSEGAGIGIQQQWGDRLSTNFGYLIDSENVANPEAGSGLFDSSASAIAQLTLTQENLALALTYTHTYQSGDNINLMGSTGLQASNEPFGVNATTSDNFGVQLNWEVSSGLAIGGWFGYTSAQQQAGGSDQATILNGALTFAFDNLWAENNQAGIIIGVPPTISEHNNSILIAQSTPLHLEALYRIELSDQIQITPGAFVIFNPDSDDGNTIWVATVRTLFSF